VTISARTIADQDGLAQPADRPRSSSTVVELRGIAHSFDGVMALRGVDLAIRPGQILGLVGENGAGKSTLVKILTGVVRPDVGTILVDGVPERLSNPRSAHDLGIAATFQEPMVFPDLDVAENVFATRHPARLGVVRWREVYERTRDVLEELGIDLDPSTPVSHLGVADRQLIEIAKALTSQARVLLLDEPTSVLSNREIGTLFGILRSLRDRGLGLVFISHKLDEVMEVTDRVAVLRDGMKVAEAPTAEISVDEIIRHMVGREVGELFPEPPRKAGEVVLEVKGLTRKGHFQDVSFKVRKGEILGFAGLVGAGRTEVAQVLFGVDRYDSGEIMLEGLPFHPRSPHHAIKCGIAYLPENRLANGLVAGMRVPFNITMPAWDEIATRWGRFRHRVMHRRARQLAERVELQAGRLGQLTSALSGGNQQKVALGKWLNDPPKVLILDEPTHGIDVGTKSEILRIIRDLVAEGMAVVLISSELEEVRSVSTRVVVMREGRVVAELPTPVDAATILRVASSVGPSGSVGQADLSAQAGSVGSNRAKGDGAVSTA
jgi:rhamnose transport system ATP-binding protein